jgi:hypothetical protein
MPEGEAMSDAKKELGQEAIQIANGFQRRSIELEKELLAMKLKKAELEAHLDAAHLAVQRLDNFRVTIGGDYQCPRCWVAHGVEATIIPQPSDTSLDVFMCRNCHDEFSF